MRERSEIATLELSGWLTALAMSRCTLAILRKSWKHLIEQIRSKPQITSLPYRSVSAGRRMFQVFGFIGCSESIHTRDITNKLLDTK
jgi:hypothetical protein